MTAAPGLSSPTGAPSPTSRDAPRPHHPRPANDAEDGREPVQKLWGSVLVPNVGSTARDYCARERNFLSLVKLATTLALVAACLLIRFQFGDEISMPAFEKYAQTPLGILFFVACLASLAAGTITFYTVSSGYEHRQAFVYAGMYNDAVLVCITALIFTTCILLLVANA
ncbi:hypothetical protein DMC30DRAFT_147981 [Rhodotorula diobovata]|uniref:DUF202 domain-containing protein n=1 Tax=Rhodotorula diobovata TaxID=5288 RepID=A0A5C5FZR2_9BASI|nr:hypothetical protein DMC30DRAFT_147981 [Rhodotorula diobovata]